MFDKKEKTKKIIDFDLKKEDKDMEMKWYEKIIVKASQNPIMTGIGVGLAILGATVTAILLGGEDDSVEIVSTEDGYEVHEVE